MNIGRVPAVGWIDIAGAGGGYADHVLECTHQDIVAGTGPGLVEIHLVGIVDIGVKKQVDRHPAGTRLDTKGLQRAVEIDPNDSVVLYNAACNYAVLERTGEALDYLEQAIRHGTVNTSWMRNDADLANIRDLPRFRELLQELESREVLASKPPEIDRIGG